MTKKELIKELRDEGVVDSITKGDEIVKSIINIIGRELAFGEEVSLFGFGKFEVLKTKARMGRNPQTGEEIEIPEGKRVKFKPASALKAKI